jgi:Fic family protein
MIHSTPALTRELRASLAELDECHARLAHELGRTAPWDGTLRREARVDAVVASTSIEGYSVDSTTAAAIVDGAQVTAGDSKDRWAIACYARAMEHVRVMADDPVFRWLDRVLLDLHFDACIYRTDRSPGRWRSGPIHVTAPPGGHAYHAPEGSDVIALMEEATTWMQEGDLESHIVVRAAMAHLHVVSIHPFRDGNGRAARLVQSLMLARNGIMAPEFGSIEGYLAAHTDQYYAHLQRAQGPNWDPTRDVTDWVTFCVEAHIHQATSFEARAAAIARRWQHLESIVGERGWPDRLVIALEQALHDGVSRASYVAETVVSPPTANGDLRRLVDAGLLVQRGRGRSTRYVASDSLRARALTD